MSRRTRKQHDPDGDRSHIPREERSYVEYHPTLLTHLGLHILRQAEIIHPKRLPSISQAASTTNGVSPESNGNTFPNGDSTIRMPMNGIHTPTNSEASNEPSDIVNGDGFAFRRQLLLNGHHIADPESLNGECDVFDTIEPIPIPVSVPQIETIAIDPALLDDIDEIAVQSEYAQMAPALVRRVRTSFDSVNSVPSNTPRNGSTRSSIPIAPSDRFLRSEVSAEEKYERLRREEGFAIGKLHSPVYRKLENSIFDYKVNLTSNAIAFGYQADIPYERPDSHYIRALDIPESLLADRVEYDMDEQDDIWLTRFNDERRIKGSDAISGEVFEITLTKIEKEWTALEKLMPKPERKDDGTNEDAKCAICDDGECETTNAIVFCDGCNLAVHQDCYGVPYIPEGQWLCRKCFASPIDPVQCLFCPSTTGAFKQTSDLHWAHLLCTNWIPEVSVGNPVFMEPIEGVMHIPSSRWKLTCYICKLKVGACIQCTNKNCYTPFHVSCARRAKLFLQYTPGSMQSTGKAYCDKHVPDEYRAVTDMESAFIEAQNYFVTHTDFKSQALAGGSARGKFTISLKRSKQSAVIPAAVYSKVLNYMMKFRIRNKADYIADMCKYWSLKRRARRGQSLLKRLQLQIEDVAANKTEAEHQAKKLAFGKKLLRELDEYQRVLLEEIMEREVSKKEGSEMRDSVIELLYMPLQPVFYDAVRQMQGFDQHKLLYSTSFAVSELPGDRLTFQKFLTNIEDAQYLNAAMFETDVIALTNNMLEAFPDTMSKEHKLGKKLSEKMLPILEACHYKERAAALKASNMTSTSFDDEFEPEGLSVREGHPWNWANRDASPLSDLDDSEVDKLEVSLSRSSPVPSPVSTPLPKSRTSTPLPKKRRSRSRSQSTPRPVVAKACPTCNKRKTRCDGSAPYCQKRASNGSGDTDAGLSDVDSSHQKRTKSLRKSLVQEVLEKSVTTPTVSSPSTRLSRSIARQSSGRKTTSPVSYREKVEDDMDDEEQLQEPPSKRAKRQR